jgi:hypothetical protein
MTKGRLLVLILLPLSLACTDAKIKIMNKNSMNGGPYLRLDGIMDNPLLTKNSCQWLSVASYTGGGTFPVTAALSYSVSAGGAGQFYFDYTACLNNSGGVSIYSGSIAASNFHDTGFYFRPASNGTLTLTSSDSAYSTATNTFTVADPVIKIALPSQLLPGVCYPFRVSVLNAEGSYEIPPPQGFTFTASAGSAVFYSSPSCSSGTTTSDATFAIGGFSSITGAPGFIKISAATTINGSASMGVQYSPFNISAGAGSAIVDGVEFSTPPMWGLPGQCQFFTLSLKNASGVHFPAQNILTVLLSADLGNAVQFFSDGSCNTQLMDNTVVFNQNEFEKGIGVLTHTESPSGNLYAVIHGSNLAPLERRHSASAALTVATQPGNTWVFPAIPEKAVFLKKIGSHEFPKTVQVSAPAGMTVTCTRYTNGTMDGGLNYPDCFGAFNPVTRNLQLTSADMGSSPSVSFWLEATSPYGWTSGYLFSKARNYPSMTVIPCAATITTQISGATFNGLASPICFGVGGGISDSTGDILIGGKQVIGLADRSTTFNLGSGRVVANGSSANLNNVKVVSSHSFNGVSFTSIATGTNEISNVEINYSAGSSSNALHISNVGASTNISGVSVLGLATGEYGVNVTDSQNISFQRLLVDGFVNGIFVRASAVSSGATFFNVHVRNADSDAVYMNGSSSFNATATFNNLSVVSARGGGPASNNSLQVLASANLTVNQGAIENEVGSAVYGFSGTSSSSTVSINDSLVLQKSATSILRNSGGSLLALTLNLNRNHFLTTVALGTQHLVRNDASTGTLTATSDSSSSNHACSALVTNPWPSPLTGGVGSVIYSQAPVPRFGAASVSGAGLCTAP